MSGTSTIKQSLLTGLLHRVSGNLRTLGLSASMRDPVGTPVGSASLAGEFCRQMSCWPPCEDVKCQIAQKACLEDARQVSAGPAGCRVLAVPIRQRRRLVGAAVGCFPTLETADSEELARACSQAKLDHQVMVRLCRQAARHPAAEAEGLCEVLEWLVRDEQANQAANEELSSLSVHLAKTYEELSLLYRISGSMKVTGGVQGFFENLCQELAEVMQLEAAAVVLLPREHSDQLEQVVLAGSLPLSAEQVLGAWRAHLQARLNEPARTLVDNECSGEAGQVGACLPGVRRLIAAPLVSGEQVKGAMIGFNKQSGEFDMPDLKLLGSITGQAAIFLDNHHLYEDLQDLLMGVLHALTASIDAKDPYTCGHSRRVAILSRKLAELLKLPPDRADRIYLAGLLHDVGKIGIPESVLLKPGRLTDQEFEKVKRHPEVGAGILGGIRQIEDVLPGILHHHERLDGRGYPSRLAGEQLPLEARIVGLADSFDAMTSCRTYRATMPLEQVLNEIRRCAGTQFDPRLVELFLSLDMEALLAELRKAVAEQTAQVKAPTPTDAAAQLPQAPPAMGLEPVPAPPANGGQR